MGFLLEQVIEYRVFQEEHQILSLMVLYIIIDFDMQQESAETQTKNCKVIDGKFVINMNQCMGGGSYSSVYAAWPKGHAEVPLACKIISKPQLDKQIAQKKGSKQSKQKLKNYIITRIQSQILIGQKVHHPNIVQFVHFSETSNNIYIFMERCESTLEQLIKKQGNLPEERALPIFRDIAAAGCCLYDQNITHRDIKAQNILIKGDSVKLADFGFAKELRDKDNQEDGTGVGTKIYMAPQLIFEEKPNYSIKCDVWSIGVVMYYVLYGLVPWDTTQTLQAFHLSLRKPVEFNPKIQVSLRMKNLISKMLLFKEQERISIKDVQLQINEMIDNAMLP